MVNSVIFNFSGTAQQVNALEARLLKNDNINVEIVNLNNNDLHKPIDNRVFNILKRLTHNSHIYVIDHGLPNSNRASQWHFSLFGDYLAQGINSAFIKKGHHKLKISLIVCNSAEGYANSLGALLHRYLGQSKGIDVDLSARVNAISLGDSTQRIGKVSIPLLEYAVRKGLSQIGITFANLSEEQLLERHQAPGSKIVFKWDRDGNAYMVDGYISKYACLLREIANEITLSLENEPNALHSVSYEIKSLLDISVDERALNKDVVKICNDRLIWFASFLQEMQGTRMAEQRQHYGQTVEKIHKVLHFSERSIGSASVIQMSLGYNVQDGVSVTDNPLDFAEKNTRGRFEVIIKKLNKLGYTELEGVVSSFVDYMNNVISFKAESLFSLKNDLEIVNFIHETIQILFNEKINYEERVRLIKCSVVAIKEKVNSNYFISPRVQGAIDGFARSIEYGGITALHRMFSSMEEEGSFEDKHAELCNNYIERFFDSIVYAAKLSESKKFSSTQADAKNVSSFVNRQLQQAINQTEDILKNLSNTKMLMKIIKQNKKTTSSVETKLEKLKNSVVNCNDETVQYNFQVHAISPIQGKLDELQELNRDISDSR